jgi:hypothetical protein
MVKPRHGQPAAGGGRQAQPCGRRNGPAARRRWRGERSCSSRSGLGQEVGGDRDIGSKEEREAVGRRHAAGRPPHVQRHVRGREAPVGQVVGTWTAHGSSRRGAPGPGPLGRRSRDRVDALQQMKRGRGRRPQSCNEHEGRAVSRRRGVDAQLYSAPRGGQPRPRWEGGHRSGRGAAGPGRRTSTRVASHRQPVGRRIWAREVAAARRKRRGRRKATRTVEQVSGRRTLGASERMAQTSTSCGGPRRP